jgi:16S rRNA (uracil1498-N3)-methyltransferase
MQFVYVKEAKEDNLYLNTKEYAHLFKVRRIRNKTLLHVRNLQDNFLYTYEIVNIDKKEAYLKLLEKKELIIKPKKELHVGWCVVDVKTVEKNLAMLNEIGVGKVTFVYADYSQKNFKFDKERIERILINSCEQCGRSNLMKFEFLQNVDEFLVHYPQSAIIDFSKKFLEKDCEQNSFLIGPEGGFTQRERELFSHHEIYGFDTPLILKSESAVMSVCAKIIL